MRIECGERWLVVHFARPMETLSWAVVGGGRRTAEAVAWRHVTPGELAPPVDAQALLSDDLEREGLAGAVGLLTSRRLAAHIVQREQSNGVACDCVVTVGMSNALRAGDPPAMLAPAGTINLLVRLEARLSEPALLEALSIAAEARTVAVLESGLASRTSGEPASGTGTDCIVLVCETAGDPLPYAGKHTLAGSLIGRAVERAVRRGVAEWREEWDA